MWLIPVCFFIVFSIAYAGKIAKPGDYSFTPITDNVHIIYGSFSRPNKQNRGFRNNPVIVQTSKGNVVRNGMLGIMPDDASFSGNIATIKMIMKLNLKYLDLLYSSVEKLYLKDIPDYKMKPEILKKSPNSNNGLNFI